MSNDQGIILRQISDWIDATDFHTLEPETVAELKALNAKIALKLGYNNRSRSDFTSLRWKAIRELDATAIKIPPAVSAALRQWSQAPSLFFAPYIISQGSTSFLTALWYTMTSSIAEDTHVGKLRFRIAVTAFASLHNAQPHRDALAKELQHILGGSLDKMLFQRCVEAGKRYRALFEHGLGCLRCLACIPDNISRTAWEVNMPLSGQTFQQVAEKLAEVSMDKIALKEPNTMFIESIPARMLRLYQQRDNFAFYASHPIGQELSEAWFESQFAVEMLQLAIPKISLSGDQTQLLSPALPTAEWQPRIDDFLIYNVDSHQGSTSPVVS